MLHPEILEQVSKYLANKKIRAQMDQANNTFNTVIENVLGIFKSSNLNIRRPTKIDKWDPERKIDPTNVDVSSDQFNLDWIRSAWKEGIRPKYKVVQGKWSKETGGGDCIHASYIKFTPQKGGNCYWLQWIYSEL